MLYDLYEKYKITPDSSVHHLNRTFGLYMWFIVKHGGTSHVNALYCVLCVAMVSWRTKRLCFVVHHATAVPIVSVVVVSKVETSF